MSSNYKTISEVIQEFQITYTEDNFIVENPFPIADYFREDLDIVMREGVVDCSEFAICENLIYPIIKEVWKSYYKNFVLWSHRSLNDDENLFGFPEYILSRRSPLGKIVFEQPYLLLVEAKQDKFSEGWGQCLAEMVSAQRMNDDYKITIYRIVSNGKTWEFGKLENHLFTKNITAYTIYSLAQLFAVVNYIFRQCELQLEDLVLV